MPNHKSPTERVSKLFSDLERIVRMKDGDLEIQVPGNGNGSAHENDGTYDAEKIRPVDQDNTGAATIAKINPSKEDQVPAPIIYEKERVGFSFAGDEIQSRQGDKPDLSVTTPLMSGGQPIGSMQIEPNPEQPWTPEEADLVNSVAKQASLQIQNLRLLEANERARAEAQEATRQFTHKNWESFLDAIHNNERIGYSYNQDAVETFIDPSPAQHDHQETVQVLDEQVGRLFVQADPTRPLTEEDKTLINSIATQIGQQVENIRLLADAARARADAEAATRRLTHQNWAAYAEGQNNDSMGFAYDSNKVYAIGTDILPAQGGFEEQLMVQGESIGQLTVMGMGEISQESRDLTASIARQTSIHLETLRLNEELQKRARELQELDRLKSAFLANMSHELRTPLNSILGFADVILEGLDGPLTVNMSNDLGLIQKNGQHLLHLINDVLDMAKIESGKMNLIIENFNLQEIIEEVTSITSTLASEKNLALFIEPDSDPDVKVFADRTRLRQVLINLINNAIKFTEKGKIAIRAHCDKDHVVIRVKDTGVGVPPELLENIFIEFTQVDSSTTRKAGGTGLGLPISRRLIEMHGGRLWAESTGVDGEGSTFFIDMPIEAKSVESEPVTKK